MQTFAQALTAELAAAGLSHTETAERVGLGQTTISAMCRGARLPTLDSLARLVSVFPRLLTWFACYVRDLEQNP